MELISKFHVTKREKILFILLIMTLILSISQYISSKQSEPPPFAEQSSKESTIVSKQELTNSENQVQEIVVDVKGAVTRPGIYHVKNGDRLQDVLTLAGGTVAEADLNHVNLALKLTDEMVVYIPRTGEQANLQSGITNVAGTSVTGESGLVGQGSTSGKININTANQSELMELDGIGETKAKAIIEYRTQNGGFKKIEDLMNVTGIGDKTFEKLREKIAVH